MNNTAHEQLDPAMLELFRAEVDTHIPVLTEGLLSLEKEPGQVKRLEALMRAAHSLKGAARIMGIEPAVQLAHVMEDCFVAAQQGKVTLTSDAVEVLLRGVDTLARIGHLENAGPDSELPTLLEQIKGIQTNPAPPPGESGCASAGRPRGADATPLADARKLVAVGGDESVPTLTPAGNLDRPTAEELRLLLLGLLDKRAITAELDLANVEELDPAGLALLAAFPRLVEQQGLTMTLQVNRARPAVVSLLRATHLDRHYLSPRPSGERGQG